MRRKNLVKGLGCLIVGAAVLVSNPASVYAGKVEGTSVTKETSATTTVSLTVTNEVWNWYDYGTIRSLNLKVNDTVYPLSKTSSSDIVLHNGDKVILLAGDSCELWNGTAKVLGTEVEVEKQASRHDCYFEYNCDTKSLSLCKEEDDFFGGGYGMFSDCGKYKYDFKAQTNSGKPIKGIAIVDDTLYGVEEFIGYEPGKTFTWGDNNTFEYKAGGYGTPFGVITCKTNEKGIADMLMPIHSDGWKEAFGENFHPSCNIRISVDEQDGGIVYANNGLVEMKATKQTLASLGVSTTLKPIKTGEMLGDTYLLVTGKFYGDKVMLKDLNGEHIATVEIEIDSINSLTKVKDATFIVGDDIRNNRDFSDIVPKVNITMATGRDDWKVAVNYEKETSTFHIVATNNNDDEEESSGNQSTEQTKIAKKIQLSKTSVTYNKKAQTPTVKVLDDEGKIILSDNYTVSYKNNKNVGQATVTVTMKGNYSGTLTANFTIKPQGTKISSVTAKKKGFTLKWKKQTSQTTGYQIQYATNNKFTSANTVLVNKNKTVTKTVSKLKAKKTYYARVRTYKTVKVNGKNTKVYSDWSAVKKVVTK